MMTADNGSRIVGTRKVLVISGIVWSEASTRKYTFAILRLGWNSSMRNLGRKSSDVYWSARSVFRALCLASGCGVWVGCEWVGRREEGRQGQGNQRTVKDL